MSTVSTEIEARPAAPEPTADAPAATVDLRPFVRAQVIGAVLGAVVLLWMLSAGHLNPLRETYRGTFYDAQARSLLDGRWDVPPDAIGDEAFEIDGRFYGYFGPLPAVLRMPVVALTDRLDGRLTVPSMAVGSVVAVWGAAALLLELRRMLRGNAPVTRGEALLAGIWTASVPAGSVLLFLVAHASFFHEAIIWGVALSTCALAVLARIVRTGRPRLVLLAVLLSGAATARLAGAAGAILLSAVVGLVLLLRERGWRTEQGRMAVTCVLAAAVAVGAFAAVNAAKFGSLFSVPYDKHHIIRQDPEALERYYLHGFIGPRYVATNLLQYLRPDALGYTDVPLWVTFPNRPPRFVGGTTFEYEPASSIPASMPLLTALALVGLVGAARNRNGSRALGIGAVVAGAGFGVTLAYSYNTHRYTGDVLPALLLASGIGLLLMASALAGQPWKRRAVTGSVVLLLAVSLVVNLSLGLQRQRGLSPAFAQWRFDVRSTVGGRYPVARMPRHSDLPWLRAGQFAVFGECDSVYLYDGTNRVAVARGVHGGEFDLVLDVTPAPPGTRAPVVANGGHEAYNLLVLEHLGDGSFRFSYDQPGAFPIEGKTFRPPAGRPFTVHVVFDRVWPWVTVRYGAKVLFDVTPFMVAPEGRPLTIGRNHVGAPAAATFTGTVELRGQQEAPGCRKLVKAR